MAQEYGAYISSLIEATIPTPIFHITLPRSRLYGTTRLQEIRQ